MSPGNSKVTLDCPALGWPLRRSTSRAPLHRAQIRVRIGLHTGEVEVRGEHYFGPALYRCARLMAIGHGGQTLLSGVTADLVSHGLPADVRLRDLGQHQLKDLDQPERVWQLIHAELPAEFPPPG